ncbi:MAG: hypothetical protein ACLFQR_12590 [Desulfovibrionales bacterium]
MYNMMKPAVSRKWLLATAGLIWSVIGALLCRLALGWLAALSSPGGVALAGLGILFAVAVYRFGFSRIAAKNIERISALCEPVCFFAFQAWRSYLLILVMVLLGYFLRHSAFPKPWLAVLYLTIGGGLFLSSFRYYASLLHR